MEVEEELMYLYTFVAVRVNEGQTKIEVLAERFEAAEEVAQSQAEAAGLIWARFFLDKCVGVSGTKGAWVIKISM